MKGRFRQAIRANTTLLEVVGVALISALALGSVIADVEGILGPDGYYHFRLAAVLWEQGLMSSVEALPLTVFGEELPDHHLLWHWLLIPFTFFEDPFVGVQVAAVVTGAMVPAGITLFARKMSIPLAPLWGLLAVCAVMTLPGRFVMLRAQNIAILLILLSLYALIKERFRTLGVVAFCFMLTYHGAVILAPLVTLYAGALWLHERRFSVKPFVFAGIGGLLGLTLNPYFPLSFEYLYFHTVLTVPEAGAATGGGSEWSSPPWSMIWEHAWAVHCLLLASLGVAGWRHAKGRESKLTTAATTLVFAALLALTMYKGANRFGEYYGPLGIMASALIFRDLMSQEDVPKGIVAASWKRYAILALLLSGLVTTHAIQGLGVVERFSLFRADKYSAIAERLRQEAEPGSMVYNSAYHDFPPLYFHAPTMRYVIGLDTHYLSEANKALYEEWRWIQQVKANDPNDPAPLIAAHFKSSFAVIAREHRGLAHRLHRSNHAKLLEATAYGWLFKVQLPREPESSSSR
tara:strand:- start:5 stop:1561 length:1557 start_codon:yes stop_codon:yes gene_type:complete